MTAPRPRRQPVGIQSNSLTGPEKFHLLKGCDFFNDAYGREHIDLDRMRADWHEFRDELLQEWIEHNPGTRPFAWWRFDATERRRPTDGRPHPFDDPKRIAAVARHYEQYPGNARDMDRLYFGVPAIVFGDGLRRYESERKYLERLALMFPGETDLPGDDKKWPVYQP